MPRPPDELRAFVEAYLDELALASDLGSLEEPMRHALGGKRVRPVLCLATGDAIGTGVEALLPDDVHAMLFADTAGEAAA